MIINNRVKCIVKRSNDSSSQSRPLTPPVSSPQFTVTQVEQSVLNQNSISSSNTNNVVMNSKAYKKLIDPLSNEAFNTNNNINQIIVNNKQNDIKSTSTTVSSSNHYPHNQNGFNDQRIIISKLNLIESNVNNLLDSQQKLSKQYTIILFLCYFLILLNLIQILFQSNFFSQYIEPQLDYLLFHKKDNSMID